MIIKKLKNFILDKNVWISRISISIIYIWFGVVKVIGLSAATPLVEKLFNVTLSSFIEFQTFFIIFSLFEIVIGILFLIPKLTKLTTSLFFFHIFLAFGPIVLLVNDSWQGFLVPTLEGQFILKNIILIALVINIYSEYDKDTNYR